MKKSLIALAALAAVGAASAQSSVTLYGVVDVGYGSHSTTTRDGTGQIRTSGVMDGANAGSRIGFRGVEDLGGGLKANFVIEQGISPTNGALFGVRTASAGHQISGFSGAGGLTGLNGSAGAYSTSTNRQSYLGLSSGMGTVNIGYQYTVVYEQATLSGYNIGSEGIQGADKAHLHGQTAFGTHGSRSNMIQYISPNFAGGFTARVQYGAGTDRESVDATNAIANTNGLAVDKQRKLGLMLQYANGPLSVGAAYTNARLLSNTGTGATANGLAATAQNVYNGVSGSASTAIQSGLSRTANLFQVGGSYDFGVAKLAATYNRGKNGGAATSPVGSAAGTPGFNSDYRAYQIGLSAPFGAFVPFVTIGRARTDVNNPNGVGPTAPGVAVAGVAGLSGNATNRTEDYRSWQVGSRYSLSKRTTAYAFYGETRNDAAALSGNGTAFSANPALNATGGGFYKDRKVIVGVAHSF